MEEEFRETISEMVGYPVDISFKRIIEEDGILHSDVIALMQCKRLDRIADALERIADGGQPGGADRVYRVSAATDVPDRGDSLHPYRRERRH